MEIDDDMKAVVCPNGMMVISLSRRSLVSLMSLAIYRSQMPNIYSSTDQLFLYATKGAFDDE